MDDRWGDVLLISSLKDVRSAGTHPLKSAAPAEREKKIRFFLEQVISQTIKAFKIKHLYEP